VRLKPLVVGALAASASFVFASSAMALPGDAGVQSSSPFRLNPYTLEPGCFIPGRGSVDLDSHLDLTYLSDAQIARELHVTLDDDAHFSVDQVLVPSVIDGYQIYNTFDTGTSGSDDDIDPNQTGVDLFAPDSNGIDGPDPLGQHSVIVCVSDHGAPQNEPYVQEDDGLVAAKNRPILAPKVTALGVSAIEPLNTYKVGFGYDVEQWYVAPSFDGAGALPTVTDPNAIPSPTFGGNLPAFVRLDPRPDDFPYDARRVNDMDTASENWDDPNGQPDYGQTRLFKRAGDLTAWTLTDNNQPDTLSHLITFTAQGDLPVTWSLRPSLAPSSSFREATLTDDQLRAWEQSWQDYYTGGAKPTMPLAPGTNSPAPKAQTIVNLPETAAPATPSAPSAPSAPATTTQVVERTTVVQQVPSASPVACSVNKTVKITLPKRFRTASASALGRSSRAHRVGKRLVVSAKIKSATAGYVTVKITGRNAKGKKITMTKLVKVC